MLRLDAVPFLWKRMGTDCQNQPEAHLLVQAFRALTRLAAPGLALKAEAIVSPDQLVQYLGAHDRYRPECDLAYDNQLMVMLWSSAGDPRRPPGRAGAGPAAARARADLLGHLRPLPRRHRLGGVRRRRRGGRASTASPTGGSSPTSTPATSPARSRRGALFQDNPATGDARTSGMAASLCGIEARSGRR